jgi:hypothetical protein
MDHRALCVGVMAGRKKGSVIAGALWMLVISVLLFWLPFIGPLIAGIVGVIA